MFAERWVASLVASLSLVAAASTLPNEPRPAAAPIVVTVTATDYAFAAPDTIAAGFTTFRLVNNSDQFHMAQLIKLEGGKTLDDFRRAYDEAFRTVGPRPAWAKRLGGPGVAGPHGDSNATLYLEPGSYVWICLVNPPPDRLPHVMKGMARPFVVRPNSLTPASRIKPEAAVVVQLVDYGFTMSAPLTAGRRMIHVQNTGAEPHEVGLAKLAAGKTVRDLEAWLKSFDGPPPAELSAGGVSSLAAKTEAYFEVDLTPGDYVLFCLVTAPDGRSHVAHGMIQHIHIG